VSLDSIDVDGLERKDRAELATIAEALGGKPTSRTKKADIIGMILDLAGVTSGGSDDEVAPAGGEHGNGRGAATPDAAAERTDDATAEGSDDATAETDDAADATTAPAEAPPADEAGTDTGTDDETDGKGEPQGRGQGRQNGQGQGRNQGNQGGQSGQGNQGGQGGQQGDGEPGNRRRRRRRGRDRDRQGEDAAGNQPQNDNWDGEPVEVTGYLDLRDEGYGFLRVKGFLPSRDDVYVSVKQTRQLGLRKGDFLEGASRPAGRGEKNPALLRIDKVNGQDPEVARNRPRFEDLTPLFPDERLRLERQDLPGDMTSRIVDLIAPIGKGQRGLIVSPPKAGKTTVMKTIAQSIEHNNPEVHLMVLLVDERPEEVTDMRRSVKGDVIASTFDRPADEHTQVAELASERAKRLVEDGKDVVIILDGITRLARAYNLAAPATGRIMSGGIDTGALYPPKKFFGAARNVEEGGSLTILATALVETGSKMDEVIFEEFKGTGNMELRLDRRAAEKRIYPAIDVDASSTRHEELLFERTQLQQVWKLRRVLSGLAAEGNTGAGLELLIDRMRTFPNNDVFLAEIAKAPGVPG
jgi:transcription termination factor Rho